MFHVYHGCSCGRRELRISVAIRDHFKKIIKSFTFLTQEEEGSKRAEFLLHSNNLLIT